MLSAYFVVPSRVNVKGSERYTRGQVAWNLRLEKLPHLDVVHIPDRPKMYESKPVEVHKFREGSIRQSCHMGPMESMLDWRECLV